MEWSKVRAKGEKRLRGARGGLESAKLQITREKHLRIVLAPG